MRIEVDRDLCEANGVCETLAPELFALDDDEVLEVRQEVPPPELIDAANAAVAQCPRAALRLVDG